MGAVNLTDANELEIVEAPPGGLVFGVCSVDIAAGNVIRQDPNTGKWVKSLATSAANARNSCIATRTEKAGRPLTGMRRGVLGGVNFAALNYGVDIFVADAAGGLADAAGTVSIRAGYVLGQFGELVGVPPKKLFAVELP